MEPGVNLRWDCATCGGATTADTGLGGEKSLVALLPQTHAASLAGSATPVAA
jgi:hypothetical protein